MSGFGSFIRSLLGLSATTPIAAVDDGSSFAKEFPSSCKRIVYTGGFNVELDLSEQVLSIKMPEEDFD